MTTAHIQATQERDKVPWLKNKRPNRVLILPGNAAMPSQCRATDQGFRCWLDTGHHHANPIHKHPKHHFRLDEVECLTAPPIPLSARVPVNPLISDFVRIG